MAREHGVATTPESIEGVRAMMGHSDISIIPTRPRPNAAKIHNAALRPGGKDITLRVDMLGADQPA